MTTIKVNTESAGMSAVEAQKRLAKDAVENHIPVKKMAEYVFNKSSLTKQEIKFIDDHRKECDRCDYNLSIAEGNYNPR